MSEAAAWLTNSDLPKLLDLLRDYQPSQVVRDELIGLARARSLIDLLMAQMLGAFAESNLWDEEGYTTPISFMREEAKMASSAACAQMSVGSGFDQLPRSVEAVEKGEIGFAHLALIADLAAFHVDGANFDERPLLAKAREQNVSEFRKTCLHAQHAMDPRRFAEAERVGHEQRFLQLKPREDGAAWLRGWFEPEAASQLRAALEPLARKQGASDDRCRDQRLADALIEQVTENQSTELVVTMTLETLEGRPGSPAAETEWGGLLSSDTAQRRVCDSSIRRMLLDGDGVVIDFGRKRRLLSPQANQAVKARDKHCQFPRGCDRPARWTSPHHIKAWFEGGPTSVEESVSLCGRHHWLVHHGWKLFRDEDGDLKAIPPIPTGWPPPDAPDG